MFSKVLVANRGEIAVRIMRTLREMGITSVALYSDADARALHVREADQAIHLGASDPAESYLNIERILEAARASAAEAIHPGYGFLSENAVFARAVREAGLTFIGPPSEVIARLGDKLAARELMAEHGIPIIAGRVIGEADAVELNQLGAELGFPLLVKAAAGGGGKGMRVVHRQSELVAAVEQASSEARGAFGDGTVYLETYLDRPRHVEFQILGDTHGNIVHLLERECSIQRRHQKIIEETPSTALSPELRQQMGESAVTAARAAGYVNAGTVEFLLDASGKYYFLEVNTRLQVEHPITELTLGLDLVKKQLEIAAGEPLGISQEQVVSRGHAIECRVYAEDPALGFIPSPGQILFARPASGPGVRFDSGVESGCQVPVHYDPILGKLIVWAEDRPSALARMARALRENVILGVPTTTGFMLDLIESEAFRTGQTHTHLIEEQLANWQPAESSVQLAAVAWLARSSMAGAADGTAGSSSQAGQQFRSPWQRLGAWDLLSNTGRK